MSLRHTVFLTALLAAALTSVSCTARTPEETLSVANTAKMEISSSAFQDGQAIPIEYTADGKNISPPLSWSGVPQNAKSLLLIVNDPDAPGANWIHWLLYNLNAGTNSLDEAVPNDEKLSNGAMQGRNSFKKIGYGGPAPPRGKAHRYIFKLYALDLQLALQPGASHEDLVRSATGHIIGHGEIMGTYSRQ